MCVPVESEQADEKTMGLAIWRGFFCFEGLEDFVGLIIYYFLGRSRVLLHRGQLTFLAL